MERNFIATAQDHFFTLSLIAGHIFLVHFNYKEQIQEKRMNIFDI